MPSHRPSLVARRASPTAHHYSSVAFNPFGALPLHPLCLSERCVYLGIFDVRYDKGKPLQWSDIKLSVSKDLNKFTICCPITQSSDQKNYLISFWHYFETPWQISEQTVQRLPRKTRTHIHTHWWNFEKIWTKNFRISEPRPKCTDSHLIKYES